jgi:integrase
LFRCSPVGDPVPTKEDLARLIASADGGPYAVPILLASTLGTRRSETLAIRWKSIDLDKGTVRIIEGLHRQLDGQGGSKLVFIAPKTNRSRRVVTLPPFAIERLKVYKKEQAERRLAKGSRWTNHDLVCERGDGQPIEPTDFAKAFKALAQVAELPAGVRLHDLRHAVATLLLEAGTHPAVASAVMGHSTVAFTLDVYSHVNASLAAEAAEVMEGLGTGNAV